MTPEEIKELVLKNRDLEFSEFIDLLKSIDEENEGFVIEEYDCAIEIDFDGIGVYIHAFVEDEICGNEELYAEVVELAEREEWEELEEKIIRFFVCVLNEDGDRITTHEDFFITTDELFRLGDR
ncbi:MAG: hypothetical protein UHU19_15830 [Lachnospiraceae bacterium]|nr:hypothetical protein [Lachnospiraceae bacterium]